MLNAILDWSRRVSRRNALRGVHAAESDALTRLVLGGGYGWLSGAYGLAVDNLVQVGIVIHHSKH